MQNNNDPGSETSKKEINFLSLAFSAILGVAGIIFTQILDLVEDTPKDRFSFLVMILCTFFLIATFLIYYIDWGESGQRNPSFKKPSERIRKYLKIFQPIAIGIIIITIAIIGWPTTNNTPISQPSTPISTTTPSPTATAFPNLEKIAPETIGEVEILYALQEGSPEEKALLELRDKIQEIVEGRISLNPSRENDYALEFNQLGYDLLLAPNDRLEILAEQGDIAALDRIFDINSIQPSLRAGVRIGEDLVGIPLSLDTTVLYYDNSKIVESPEHIDKLKELLEQDHTIAIVVDAFHLYGFGEIFGGKPYDGVGFCDGDTLGWSKTLEYLDNLKEINPNIYFRSVDEAREAFLEGTADMIIDSPRGLPLYREKFGNNLKTAVLPGQVNLARPLINIYTLSLRKEAHNPDGALSAIRAFTSQEAQIDFAQSTNRMPADFTAIKPDSLMDAFLESAQYGTVRVGTLRMRNYLDSLDQALRNVLLDDQTPEDALAQLCDEVNFLPGLP